MTVRKALVLGGTGMIGSALCRRLLEDGYKVYAASRLKNQDMVTSLQDDGVRIIHFDVVQDAPGVLPDVDLLFLEIWDPSRPSLVWPVNFYGVGRVVERYAGIADVVNGSTINVYGDMEEPASEDSPCRPTSYYGHSRQAQEKLIDFFCDKHHKRCINLRYAHVNCADHGLISRFAHLIAAGATLGQNPDARLQVIAREDVVRMTADAVKCLADHPVNLNVCHPRVWTQRELAEEIHKRLGRGEVVFDRTSGGEDASAYADVSKMIEWFGEPRVPLDTLIGRVVDKMK